MRSGQLRSQIDIERRGSVRAADARDEYGQEVERWLPVAVNVRADIRFPTGMGTITAERTEGGRELSTVHCSVRLRWRKDITADMRVKIDVAGTPTYFDIKQVIPDLDRKSVV